MQSMLPSRCGRPILSYWRMLDVSQKLYFVAGISIFSHAFFLLLPSGLFGFFGIDAKALLKESMPSYIQFSAYYSTTLFFYWVSYPYIAGINSLMFLVALNTPRGFRFFAETYLRGSGALASIKAKLKLWLLAVSFWTMAILVVWVFPQTPNRHGFHPVSSPIMLFLIYGCLFSMLLPLCVAVMLTDIRSWFFKTTYTEK